MCRPMVSILDVEEQEGSSHEHAQYGYGGQDAVEWHVDVAPLMTYKRTILRRLHTYKTEEERQNTIILSNLDVFTFVASVFSFIYLDFFSSTK